MLIETLDKPVKQRLLYTREQLSELLGGVSISSVMKLEREGRLTPVTLNGRGTGQKFFPHDDVIALLKSIQDEAAKRSKGKPKKIERKRLA